MTPADQHAEIVVKLVDYVLSQHPSKFTRDTLPRDESLLELGSFRFSFSISAMSLGMMSGVLVCTRCG